MVPASSVRFACRFGLTALAAALFLCSGGDWRRGKVVRQACHILCLSAANAGDRGDPKEEQGRWQGENGGGAARGPVSAAHRPSSEAEGQHEIYGISYDAAKNMLRLHLHFGTGKSNFDMHRSTSSVLPRWGKNKPSLPPLGEPGWHQDKSLELLEKSVGVTQDRYQHAMNMPFPPNGSSTIGKTNLSFGGLSFAPYEVLGVGLDDTSIEHAKFLGFIKTGESSLTAQGDRRIVRFLVPPSWDAPRAQDLLTKELPGHRFETNKIYRLYRAAMKDDLGLAKAGEPVLPGTACPPDRCFARKIIQWQDQLSPCARGQRIGVIDTKIDRTHPTFQGALIHEAGFAPDNRPAAPDWHGTGVLALLAGNPASGTPGLVPRAEFFAASIFFSEANGAMATDTVSLMRALGWMQDNDVRIINMSFAGPPDGLVKDEIEKLRSRGVVLVAAAGNEGPAADPAYPAAYPQVIAVTAVAKDLVNYRYANRGDHIDVAAPGVDIWTAVPGAREGYHSGTSFAAPHVTGILALLPRDSLIGNKNDLLDSLPFQDLGAQGRDPVYGRGLLVAPPYCTPPSETVASAAP